MLSTSSFTTSEALLLLLVSAVVIPLIAVLYNISPFHPLAAYPGPLLWRATRLTWIVALHRGNIHGDLKAFHDQYGPVVRIAPNELSYTDSRAWKDIYGGRPNSGDPIFERNNTWFKPLRPGDPMSVMGHDEASHAKQRKALMSAFTDRAVGEQAAIVEEQVELFVDQLRQRSVGKQPVDLVDWLNFVLFDISGLLTFGESFNSTGNGKAHPWVAISSKFGKGVALRASLNFLGQLGSGLGAVLALVMPKDIQKKIFYHMEMSRALAEKKLHGENKGRRADFMDAMIRYNDAEKGEKVSDREMDITATILIFAGAETTATALSGTLSHLMLPANQRVLKRVTREVRERFQSEEDIKISTVQDLPYLNGVLSEGIRLAPPAAIGVPRVTPKGGATVAGRLVPGGTYVAVNQVPAFLSSSNFTNADKFEPDRFMTPRKDDDMAILNPFGIGRHQCLGMRLAWAELRLILARLLYAFEIEAVDAGSITKWGSQKTFIVSTPQALELGNHGFWITEDPRLCFGLSLHSVLGFLVFITSAFPDTGLEY